MLEPLQRQNLSVQAFKKLRDEILNEKYLPGERLPSERQLSDILKINRASVREALIRLEQARFIEIRHGEGSVVIDFKVGAQFEILHHLIMAGGKPDVITLRSVTEIRALITGEIVRLAALRIQKPDLARLEKITEKIESPKKNDIQKIQALDFEFYYTMAMAGENLGLVLIYNSIREIYLENSDFFSIMFESALLSPEIYRRIFKALKDHNPDEAVRLNRSLIENGNKAFMDNFLKENYERETRR